MMISSSCCCRYKKYLVVASFLLVGATGVQLVQAFQQHASSSSRLAFLRTSSSRNQGIHDTTVIGPLFAIDTKTTTDVASNIVPSKNWNDIANQLEATLKASSTSLKEVREGGGNNVPEMNVPQIVTEMIQSIQSLVHQGTDQFQLVAQQINDLAVAFISSLTTTASIGGGERTIPSITSLFNNNNNNNVNIVKSLEPFLTQWKETVVSSGLVSNDDAIKVIQEVTDALIVLNNPISIGIILVVTYSIINTIQTWGDSPPPGRPYPSLKYDPTSAATYFKTRPFQVVNRALTIAFRSFAFGIKLLVDKFVGGEQVWIDNQEQRGIELSQLLTELGPTFIKIGQSLSIRTDLLSPAYLKGLATLQDRVPAFDTATAKEILEEEWGVPNLEDVIVGGSLSSKPVAAASLGQVYKAKLVMNNNNNNNDDTATGNNNNDNSKDVVEVAIKVQRPDITEQIALDMHLLRVFAPIAKQIFNLNTDTVGTVDTWAAGFVDELDYIQEAKNGQYFSEQIKTTSLKNVVLAPTVIDDYTSGKVLVTEWVDGERLDRSSQSDVTILCSICMNAYLSMLLEMGILHCDPHPGNLLRTPEGKLCILDWGMVTKIPSDLQITLIEHMAHLTSGDYAEVPRDLYLLGFVPADKEDVIEDSGVVDVLADIYGKWTSGGGLATINANEVLVQMQGLAATRGNLFQIPPYFAYIAKSFSVIEGIGLSNDPKYSIINECLPYVSNRLLTDQDQMGNALNTFVFGPDKSNVDTRLVDIERIEQLVTGFGNFSATSASGVLSNPSTATTNKNGNTVVDQQPAVAATASSSIVPDANKSVGGNSISLRMLEKQADQILDIVLTEEETPLQQILIEQLCKILAANTRSLWTEARLRSGVLPTGRTVLGTIVDPLGLFQTSPLVNACDQDERAVQTTKDLITLLRSISNSSGGGDNEDGLGSVVQQSLTNEEQLIFSRILSQKLFERRSALIKSSNRFVNQMLQLTATRLESPERVKLAERVPTVGRGVSNNNNNSNYDDDATKNNEVLASSTTINANYKNDISSRLQKARDRLNTLSS